MVSVAPLDGRAFSRLIKSVTAQKAASSEIGNWLQLAMSRLSGDRQGKIRFHLLM